MIDQRPIGFMANCRDQRDHAGGCGAHDDLFVEAPQILKRAAAARHDDHIRPGYLPALWQRVETFDGAGHFRPTRFALHAHRPDDDPQRKPILHAVQYVTDHRAGWRCDDADHAGQKRQQLLARIVKQALGRKPPAALFKLRQQRANARFSCSLIPLQRAPASAGRSRRWRRR